jgi:hypothetical protein
VAEAGHILDFNQITSSSRMTEDSIRIILHQQGIIMNQMATVKEGNFRNSLSLLLL